MSSVINLRQQEGLEVFKRSYQEEDVQVAIKEFKEWKDQQRYGLSYNDIQIILQSITEELFRKKNIEFLKQTALAFISNNVITTIDSRRMCGNFIRSLNVLGSDVLIEVFSAVLEKCSYISAFIDNFYTGAFGIPDEKDRIKLAKIVAVHDSCSIGNNIQEFCISDEKTRVEIAMIAAQKRRGVADNIEKFNISDENRRIEIAKIIAERDGKEIALTIQKFSISDENRRIEIAKIAAKNSPQYVATYIKKFDISDEKARIEIAEICLEQNAKEVANYIQNFNISDINKRSELAQKIATRDGRAISERIQDFRIYDKETMVKIAIAAAKQNGSSVIKNIRNFALSNDLAMIVCIIAERDRENLIKSIKNFNINSKFKLLIDYLELREIFDLILLKLQADNPNYQFTDEALVALKKIYQNIIDEKNPLWQQNMLECFYETIAGIYRNNISSEQIVFLRPLLEKIQKYREPERRKILINLALDVTRTKYNQLHDILSQKPDYQHLPGLYLIDLINDAHVCEQIFQLIHRMFRDVMNARILIDVLSFLKASNLSQEDKIFLLRYALEGNKKEILIKLTAIQGICRLEETQQLTEANLTRYNLDTLFQQIFNQHVEHTQIDNFATKFNQTFARFRNPWALLTYAQGIKTLQDRRLMSLLGKYIESVLNGDFEVRYDKAISPHLKKIFSYNSKIEELWRKSDRIEITPMSGNNIETNIKEYLKTKIITDRHLGNCAEKLPYLYQYLINNTKPTIELKRDELVKLQKLCIELCEASASERVTYLDRLLAHLHEMENVRTFMQDIEELKQQLLPKEYNQEAECTIEDYPEDYLVVASETTGCQRVDGNPSLNKALLAYMMDGKNRIIAIKDKKTGKLIARAIFRILWDRDNNKPMLFVERFYPSNIKLEHQKAIHDMAIKRGREMNLDVVTSNILENTERHLVNLASLGGIAPFEYSDAAGGMFEGGKFIINGQSNLYLLFKAIDADSNDNSGSCSIL